MPGHGIHVVGPARVTIVDTSIRDNLMAGMRLEDGVRAVVSRSTVSGNAGQGIWALCTVGATTTTVDIVRSTLSHNGTGLAVWSQNFASAATRVSVRESQLVGNETVAATLQSYGAGPATLTASNSVIANSLVGIQAYQPGALAFVTGTSFSGNNTALSSLAGGAIESTGNNATYNNAEPNFGTVGAVPLM